jgi:hypothetical protein
MQVGGKFSVAVTRDWLYDLKRAAHLLSISVEATERLIAAGALDKRRIGGKVLVPHASLFRYAPEQITKKIASEVKDHEWVDPEWIRCEVDLEWIVGEAADHIWKQRAHFNPARGGFQNWAWRLARTAAGKILNDPDGVKRDALNYAGRLGATQDKEGEVTGLAIEQDKEWLRKYTEAAEVQRREVAAERERPGYRRSKTDAQNAVYRNKRPYVLDDLQIGFVEDVLAIPLTEGERIWAKWENGNRTQAEVAAEFGIARDCLGQRVGRAKKRAAKEYDMLLRWRARDKPILKRLYALKKWENEQGVGKWRALDELRVWLALDEGIMIWEGTDWDSVYPLSYPLADAEAFDRIRRAAWTWTLKFAADKVTQRGKDCRHDENGKVIYLQQPKKKVKKSSRTAVTKATKAA